jgi:hypothetical protein
MGVKAELGKVLELDWKSHNLVLTDEALTSTASVYAFLFSVLDNQELSVALGRYTTGLALFAKSDLHLRLELYSWVEFFSGLKQAVAAFGDKANGESIADALRRIIPKEAHNPLNKCLEIDEVIEAANGVQPKVDVTLTEVISAKSLFDYYMRNKTQDWVNEKQANSGK